MIKKALRQITIISDNDDDNTENYLDALNYLDNIYKVVNVLMEFVGPESIEFLPSFKGRNIVERLGILSTNDENELKYFRIKSRLFSGNVDIKNLIKALRPICKQITQEEDVLCLTLN